MSGELILRKGGTWKTRLISMLITGAGAVVILWPLLAFLKKQGVNDGLLQIVLTIAVPVLIFMALQELVPQLARFGTDVKLPWSLKNGTLTLGDKSVPQKSIKMVHCWCKKDTWTINIETTGENFVYSSVDGDLAEASVQRLYELVEALGYRARWRAAAK